MSERWVYSRLVAVLMFLCAVASVQPAVSKPFTVAEEIGIAHFGDPYGEQAQSLQFSPDGKYFAALTERGRIDLDRPEDTLRIYRTQEVLSFLGRPNDTHAPAPLWVFNRSTDQDGPLITHWRWLTDSSGIAFLERGAHGSNRLVLANLKQKTIEALTPKDETIKAFDIRDRRHYVYAVADRGLLQRAAAERKATSIAATGRSLIDLLFPADRNPQIAAIFADRSELWAVVGGKPFWVKDRARDQALVLFGEGQRNLALSPDGQSLVTALGVAEIPVEWEKRYPPPYEVSPIRLRAGKQDLTTFTGDQLVSRYARIELRSGTVRWLSDAPTGDAAGWAVIAGPAWSQDGKAMILPDAFLASDPAAPARACVAVVTLSTAAASCVVPIEGPDESGSSKADFHLVKDVRFANGDTRRLVVSYYERGTQGRTEYQQTATGTWAVVQQTPGADPVTSGSLDVTVKQGLNDPPVLWATDSKTQTSRMIWDPNPQFKDIALGEATVLKWKDKAGRDWNGGLFKPVPYEAGRRYPLVIQTHGFSESEFRPSGVFPTAFAARALASAGLAVLQVDGCSIALTPEEGPCNVDGYEAAVSELVKDGLVNSERIGIIGFSRTCFYVMEALTTSALHIKAASITDGVMENYLQYMTMVDVPGFANENDAMVGARPFGAGLQQWLQHSPLFNMDKVSAALQVVAEGRADLPFMWEPYAAMRYLHKPVDLILLNTNEHVLSNPAARMVSQGGAVDWMRFWLQDYEDADSSKSEQYVRWRKLRDLAGP